MGKKYQPLVPQEYWTHPLYASPPGGALGRHKLDKERGDALKRSIATQGSEQVACTTAPESISAATPSTLTSTSIKEGYAVIAPFAPDSDAASDPGSSPSSAPPPIVVPRGRLASMGFPQDHPIRSIKQGDRHYWWNYPPKHPIRYPKLNVSPHPADKNYYAPDHPIWGVPKDPNASNSNAARSNVPR